MNHSKSLREFLRELNRNARMQAELQSLSERGKQAVTAGSIRDFAAAHGYEIAVGEFSGEEAEADMIRTNPPGQSKIQVVRRRRIA